MDFDIAHILLFYLVLLASLVVHEAAHALFALLGGDTTAYSGGQVSLNPIPHIKREPFGTVILPLIMLFSSKGAWCMGFATTPIDPDWAHRHPKRAALMAAAGPMSNFLLVALAIGVAKLMVGLDLADNWPSTRGGGFGLLASPIDDEDTTTFWALKIATAFALLNLVLGMFNLFPWPPLDGAGVVGGLFPRLEVVYDNIRRNGFLVMGGMIAIAFLVLPKIIGPAFRIIIDLV